MHSCWPTYLACTFLSEDEKRACLAACQNVVANITTIWRFILLLKCYCMALWHLGRIISETSPEIPHQRNTGCGWVQFAVLFPHMPPRAAKLKSVSWERKQRRNEQVCHHVLLMQEDRWTENVKSSWISPASLGPGFILQIFALSRWANYIIYNIIYQNYIFMGFWCWVKLPTIQTCKGMEWVGDGGNALISIFLSCLWDLLHLSRHWGSHKWLLLRKRASKPLTATSARCRDVTIFKESWLLIKILLSEFPGCKLVSWNSRRWSKVELYLACIQRWREQGIFLSWDKCVHQIWCFTSFMENGKKLLKSLGA